MAQFFSFFGAVWNLAITFGLLGILDGHMLGHELLEMPKEVWPALFVSYLVISFLIFVTFRSRRQKDYDCTAMVYYCRLNLVSLPLSVCLEWIGNKSWSRNPPINSIHVVRSECDLAVVDTSGSWLCLLYHPFSFKPANR